MFISPSFGNLCVRQERPTDNIDFVHGRLACIGDDAQDVLSDHGG